MQRPLLHCQSASQPEVSGRLTSPSVAIGQHAPRLEVAPCDGTQISDFSQAEASVSHCSRHWFAPLTVFVPQ
jgi:hypothetical protein